MNNQLDTEIEEIIFKISDDAIAEDITKTHSRVKQIKALIEREVEKAFDKVIKDNTDKDLGTTDFDGIAEDVIEKARGK